MALTNSGVINDSATNSSAAAAHVAHVHALQSKHAGLEARLREELARPAPDPATIQTLKKRKLALKEEIARH